MRMRYTALPAGRDDRRDARHRTGRPQVPPPPADRAPARRRAPRWPTACAVRQRAMPDRPRRQRDRRTAATPPSTRVPKELRDSSPRKREPAMRARHARHRGRDRIVSAIARADRSVARNSSSGKRWITGDRKNPRKRGSRFTSPSLSGRLDAVTGCLDCSAALLPLGFHHR